jgi:uncharacterized protein with HEPN domain
VSRDWRLYWEDVLLASRKVRRFTAGMEKAGFRADERTYDAVLRNLEVIGEAVKNLPDEARNRAPSIQWKKIAGLRDVIAHGYFGIDDEILWDIVARKVPELLAAMEAVDPPLGDESPRGTIA